MREDVGIIMCRASVAECPQVQSVHFPILSTFFLISLFNSYSGIMKKVFTLNMYIVHRISYKIYIFVVSEISWNLFFTFFFHVNAEKLLHLVAHFHNSWKFLKTLSATWMIWFFYKKNLVLFISKYLNKTNWPLVN